ncbi:MULTISPECIES: GlxA family transcriptional regulator [unclassified Caballeronia]|uniref:GlxA family transcriptional regulator n=1 Tax=unclassified Caballeronia TaxID=2646786 RepID=UPI0020292B8D|nr:MULTISPECIES: GlxA family transcriptional regulator [unclassified Caballeronia]
MNVPDIFHFLILPGFSALGFMSAIEPLRVANRFRKGVYQWVIVSSDGNAVPASNGIMVQADVSMSEVTDAKTVFVVSGFEPLVAYTPTLGAWLRQLSMQGAVLGGIDTGVFTLAEANLIGSERVTLHWEAASSFNERYPSITYVTELFELCDQRITCAGGTATIDLMLDIILRRHGAELAFSISEQFVLGGVRERSDHQRMQVTARYNIHNAKLVLAIELMEHHMEEPLATDEIAKQVGITRRQLERLFCHELADTPARFYTGLRLTRARQMLQNSTLSIMEVCIACGFESPSHFSRAYRAKYSLAPRNDRSTPPHTSVA